VEIGLTTNSKRPAQLKVVELALHIIKRLVLCYIYYDEIDIIRKKLSEIKFITFRLYDLGGTRHEKITIL
jgi:hypothetical protein